VRIWKMDTSDNEQEYPLVCNSVIQTGHTQNIFSAQMLPYSERMYVYIFDFRRDFDRISERRLLEIIK